MPFVFSFDPTATGMTAAQYDEVTKTLESQGYGHPKGRLYHACYGEPDNLKVTDIWDSMENFQAFGQKLLPLLQKQGVNPGQPQIHPVHNIVNG